MIGKPCPRSTVTAQAAAGIVVLPLAAPRQILSDTPTEGRIRDD